ncbi:MAG TPA: ACT domain-containing protein, partial [Microbacterium sp.]|nr:ACT domain-containing protein [Microbacterium sp.]
MATVLFVVTSARTWTLADGTAHPTGYWAEELVTPYRLFTEAGHDVVFATPAGVAPVADEGSLSLDANGGEDLRPAIDAIEGLSTPLALDAIELEAYDAVFYPGGHGPMEDLSHDEVSGALLIRALDEGLPLGLVCHGLAALVAAKRADGSLAAAGRRVTAFTDEEERQGALAARVDAARGRARGRGRGALGRPPRRGRSTRHRAEPAVVRLCRAGAARAPELTRARGPARPTDGYAERMTTLVLTVVGDDRAGLVAAVAAVIDSHGGNWENSQLAELAGAFAGIIEVSVAPERADALRAALENIEGLVTVAVTGRSTPGDAAPAHRFTFEVLGNDHPGIVRELSSTLSDHGVSIERMTSATRDAAMAGGRLFEATISATVPA